jgi:hypothetical protein
VFVAPACCAGLSISPALDTFLKERTREQSKAYNYKRAPEQMAVRRAKKQLKAKRKEDVRTEAGGYNTGAYEGEGGEGEGSAEAGGKKKRTKRAASCCGNCRTVGCRRSGNSCKSGGPSLYPATLEAERVARQGPSLSIADFTALTMAGVSSD